MGRIGRHRYSFLELYMVWKHKRTLAKVERDPNRRVAGTNHPRAPGSNISNHFPLFHALFIPAELKPLPLLPAQIHPPQTTHTLTLAPLLHIPRRHLPIEPDLIQPPRVQPRRKVLQNDRVIHEHLLMPARVCWVFGWRSAGNRPRDVAEERHVLRRRAGYERRLGVFCD